MIIHVADSFKKHNTKGSSRLILPNKTVPLERVKRVKVWTFFTIMTIFPMLEATELMKV